MDRLHLVHINVNGLRTRNTELEEHLRTVKPDIALLKETKLNSASTPRFAGYKLACPREITRDKVRLGGVTILVAKATIFADISPHMVAIELQARYK
jgi:exonuclease III